MQNFVQPVNVEALRLATEAIVGPEVTDTILRTYKAIDQAMFASYQMGQMDAEERVDARIDNAFEEGYAVGRQATASEEQLELFADEADAGDAYSDGYDEGYIDGVSDARAHPATADENVQDIINAGAGAFYDVLEDVQDEA